MLIKKIFFILFLVSTMNLRGDSDTVSSRAVVFSPNGNIVAVSYDWKYVSIQQLELTVQLPSCIRVFESGTSRLLWEKDEYWAHQRENILALSFSPDGRRLASGSSHGAIHVFNATTGELIRELPKQDSPIKTIVFNPRDSNILVTGSANKNVQFWNIGTGNLIRSIGLNIPGQLQSLSFSPDGNMIACGLGTGPLVGGVQVYNANTGAFIYIPEQGQNGRREWDDRGIYSVSFSPDGRFLAAGTAWGRLLLWDAGTGRFIWEVACETFSNTLDLGVMLGMSDINGITSIAFSPNSRIIVCGSINGMIEFRNTTDGSIIGNAGNENDMVYSLSYNPRGRMLAFGTKYGWRVLDTTQIE